MTHAILENTMKIAVIGTGFVGVVTAAVYASFGHEVCGLDIDANKIAKLKKSELPFFEPKLQKLLVETQKKGKLKFTSSYSQAITGAQVVIIAVGTPSNPDGSVNLNYLYTVIDTMIEHLELETIIVVKSTVPPGIFSQLKKRIQAKTSKAFELASVPEFLREGSAVHDTLNPDRIVLGVSSPKAFGVLEALHQPLKAPIVRTNPESAQLAKYAANAYLALRITFINQIADLCQKSGADVEEVIKAIGFDQRIGAHYWYPGPGFGGSCFPKDVKELAYYSTKVGEADNLFVKVDQLNSGRITELFSQYAELVGGFKGKKVAVLGLAFKPDTDDMREAPSLKFVPKLIKAGAQVVAFDPVATKNSQVVFGRELQSGQLSIVQDLRQALNQADVILILVEWPEFINFDYGSIKDQTKKQWLIDTRNRLDKNKIANWGFVYQGVGRQT